MADNQLVVHENTILDNIDAEQVEFSGEVDGDEYEFVVGYDVLEALSGDPPEGDAQETFDRFSDTIAEAALSALSRYKGTGAVIVSEGDLEEA